MSTGCENTKCKSDLSVYAYIEGYINGPYTIGSSDMMTLVVEVTNEKGAPAYKPTVHIEYQQDKLPLLKNVKGCRHQVSHNKTSSIFAFCILMLQGDFGDGWLGCSLSGPMLEQESLTLRVEFDAKRLSAGLTSVSFSQIMVTSESIDLDINNNEMELTQLMRTELDLEMVGRKEEDIKTFMLDEQALFLLNFFQMIGLVTETRPVTVSVGL